MQNLPWGEGKVKRFFNPKGKRVIFFDMNHTLFDPVQGFHDAFRNVLSDWIGRWDSDEAFEPEKVFERYVSEWKKKPKLRSKSAALTQKWKQECLSCALKPYSIPLQESSAQSFFRKLKERQDSHPRLYPGVFDTVSQLAEQYRLAIISNGSKEKQLNVLKASKLLPYFKEEHLFSSASEGVRKPQSSLFLRALEVMHIEPGQGVMVGDSWKNDIMGAMRVRMDAVWIHPAHTKKISLRKIGCEKIVIIRKFEQLKRIF